MSKYDEFIKSLDTSRKVHKYMRSQDESRKWPVRNKFNVTDRAIRHLRGSDAVACAGQIYIDALDREISKIVNNFKG